MKIDINDTIQDPQEIEYFEKLIQAMANNISYLDIEVDSLEDAIRKAEELQSEGYDLFRGQSGLWPVISNLNRLENNERNKMIYKAFIIDSFLEKSQEVKTQDERIAVLQHYGIPTNFVDFTTDPNVAAFFSTQISGHEPNEYGCIICIDSEEVQTILNIYTKNLRPEVIEDSEKTFPGAEVIDMFVENLFRQEAQKGKFLFLPFVGFEVHIPYKRIVFKNSIENKKKYNKLDFFPEEQSSYEENMEFIIKFMNQFEII